MGSIDFSEFYTLFTEPGNYVFLLKSEDKEYIQQIEVKYRGTIGKIFVGVFYAPIYNLMVYLIQFFGNSLGMAIIAITIVIRILLLFPQHKMMVSQRKMQAIQPKIKKLQEKHKGDQQTMGMELMKLYKTE
jgi:membrane protein insertase Oxa1/YidC/SpoIIIJ